MSYPGQQPSKPPYAPHAYPGSGGASTATDDERTWALASHIGTLVAAWFAMGFLAPLAVLLVKGGSSPFVKRHATESLNFQQSLLVYAAIAVVLVLVTLGLGLLVIVPIGICLAILALIAIIMATMAASRGDDFRYPLTIRFLS